MKLTPRIVFLAVLTSLCSLTIDATRAEQVGKSPVKVFLLAGQSNMEGHGAIAGTQKGTLETLTKDAESAPRFKHLLDNEGKWVVRDDVWASYGTKGKLTVGGFAGRGAIGPELGIGWVLGDYLDNQVLLVKVAVGGTSLAQNWRPPTSGGEVGGLYKAVLDTVKELPNSLPKDFPDYDGRGFEIAGFCWHQGWQDGCAQPMVDEYETNMVNFIKDIRRDLGLPKLPFVIGGSGFGGWEQKVARRLQIAAAQKTAAEREEFRGNVLYVETRGFFRPRELSPNGFGFHWNCNAETYYLIGDGMGRAMVELLGGPKAPPTPVNPNPPQEKPKTAGAAKDVTVVKLEELTLDLGNQISLKLVKIPAGKFRMGSPLAEEDRWPDETPHDVTLTQPFFVGIHEVTVAQFDQFVKDAGYTWTRPVYDPPLQGNHPATNTTWPDAQAFCQWLSKKSGRTVALPTEAQWEYACRGGATTRFCSGDFDDDLSGFGHFASDGWDYKANPPGTFATVGCFKPNAFGLYDMHGNLLEWCSDFYGPYPETAAVDPTGPTTGVKHIQRGGNWHANPGKCRSAQRFQAAPDRAFNRDGLRVVVLDPHEAWRANASPVYSDPDDHWAKDPSIIQAGGTYYMFYTSANPWQDTGAGGRGEPRIDYATSPDGLTWTRQGPAIEKGPPGQWDDTRPQAPTKPLLKDGVYYMYYAAAGKTVTIGLATSTDLVHWNKHPSNPVIHELGKCNDPFLYEEAGIYYLFFNDHGENVHYVTSHNLVDWSPQPIRTGAVGEGNIVVKANGGYTMLTAVGHSHSGEYYKSWTSPNLTTPFTDQGRIQIDLPTWAQGAFGHGDIVERDGEHWLYFQGTNTGGKIFQIGLAKQAR